ncbi:putative ala-tRNApro hydrolase ProX [Aeropyrum pernix K1]|uniref:Ala-tRNApro hydrolase ProX n=1 Tax=Aeropyrum pernix (strain ATCC 700893 / DSM 11879 / JCM 9820 / NBRC 100138 / K1) TaxID=272557 RepID=Q9Y8U3_AERPE|nr:YbaK/EbsC family protein [Aeropyrum pernix]BAA81557.2 putative ala-tRNApro hydrolase ProX [Aeropyrum pernix K1]
MEKVEEWIKARGLTWRLLIMQKPTRTVAEAAALLGVSESEIVKTLIVLDNAGGVYAVVIPGDKRLNINSMKELAGKPVRLARANEVVELTGYPVGGVPPVALPPNIVLVVDRILLSRKKVYGGGGRENALLEFSPRELVEATGAVVADVSE